MKLSKIIDKISKYFKKDRLKNSQEEKVLKLIEELKEKKVDVKKEIKELKKDDDNKRIQLNKKLFAINKLIESAEELLKDK
ncbi:hypothetical protein [Aliarcobacter cibarius]|uniref:DUF904 domain-containing protein n=1 Tax=Aliarcobacter cibarius TaxID=255507 RepID=A0A5J6RGD5_9BACT|nr:hypothetical protein [Aliarcobacter cibarius]QEZ89300.1 hypothetical protein ACIB15232_1188 [Aliarcobacter cibarius]QKJ27333.1 hypothetical protein ACBT_1427 [Aliarcobacter cibarius]TLS95616.1 hypothetical protein FE247_10865 [Aliarcobacter cibarius]TLS96150.1 hypothetical protein FE245_10920 [Aliarcobacter cibarius]